MDVSANRRSRFIMRCVSSGLVLSLSSVCVLAQGQSVDQTVGDEDTSLSALFTQCQSYSSIHFLVDVSVSISAATAPSCCINTIPGSTLTGQIEYWSSGDRYRINNYFSPDEYPGMDIQFAYDGNQFYLYRPGARTLSFSNQDNARFMSLPNPMLELVRFCYPLTDANAQDRLRFKDVAADAVPNALQTAVWESASLEDGSSVQMSTFKGGVYEGRKYVHHLYAAPGAHNRPMRMERVSEDGTMTSTEFSDYFEVRAADGRSTHWPRVVVMRAFDDATGSEVLTIKYRLSEFSLDGDIPSSVFRIDSDVADQVWDDELEMFVSP